VKALEGFGVAYKSQGFRERTRVWFGPDMQQTVIVISY
jgi:hypothetical protein